MPEFAAGVDPAGAAAWATRAAGEALADNELVDAPDEGALVTGALAAGEGVLVAPGFTESFGRAAAADAEPAVAEPADGDGAATESDPAAGEGTDPAAAADEEERSPAALEGLSV